MRYILREPDDASGIYLVFGNVLHNALEQLYEGNKGFEFLNEEFNRAKFEAIDLADLKFNDADADKNKAIELKYLACLEHFSKNHHKEDRKVASEQFILTNITEDNTTEHFMGYIDAVHVDYDKDAKGKDIAGSGTVYITDYKTSTRYTGAKIGEHANQLILNALGISQSGNIPMEKIKARWNFLKYMTVSYVQKNKKVKDTICERHEWVSKMEVSLRAKLKEFGIVDETERDVMVEEAINKNTMDNIPKEVRDAYTFDDAYVYVDLSPENIAKVKKELMRLMKEIREKEKADDSDVWEVEVVDSMSYFCTQLCGYKDKCPCYKEYADNRSLFIDKPKEKEEEVNDISWMAELFN